MKCIRPLAHNPQFEGKYKCKACIREQNEIRFKCLVIGDIII